MKETHKVSVEFYLYEAANILRTASDPEARLALTQVDRALGWLTQVQEED